MSDIHQEWNEFRQKNGDFAGAFAMQFVAPSQFNCCQDYRDILKALNKAQADRIKFLEDEFLACKEQQRVDQAVKKDLDEKLDKAAADYKALWVERDNLMDTISRMEKTIRDLDERNGTLRERLANANASLKRSIQENVKLRTEAAYIDKMRIAQGKEIERLRTIVNTSNGSCSAYTQQGMQSKIAKQANEIKRLTEENEALSERLSDQTKLACNRMFERNAFKLNVEQLTEENRKLRTANGILDAACDNKDQEIENYKKALDIAAKDADANFERGKIKGMGEIWDELKDCYDGRPTGENEKIFGYCTVGEIVGSLSPTWFMNLAEEYHKQKEKEEARYIKLGDEVIVNSPVSSDDPDYNIGIVIAVDEDHKCFVVVGPKFEGCFDMTDIDAGNTRKTGKHYDSIPIDYFT